ncbi:hypothetical protein ACK3F5_03275 [Photorhabdus asymbiotica UENP]
MTGVSESSQQSSNLKDEGYRIIGKINPFLCSFFLLCLGKVT